VDDTEQSIHPQHNHTPGWFPTLDVNRAAANQSGDGRDKRSWTRQSVAGGGC